MVFPDFHAEPGPLRHGDDHVLVEVTLAGTQAADWAGIPHAGRSFDAPGRGVRLRSGPVGLRTGVHGLRRRRPPAQRALTLPACPERWPPGMRRVAVVAHVLVGGEAR